jgi:hypothetical protein
MILFNILFDAADGSLDLRPTGDYTIVVRPESKSVRRRQMKFLCVISTIGLAMAFLALNLFLPLALIIFAAAVALGIYCGVVRPPGKSQCRFGAC